MFEKTDKRRLYWLIKEYLAGKIDAPTFCNEYYYCYDLELDYKSLTQEEAEAFYQLSKVVGRFSEFDEDHQKYPGTYSTEEELKKKVIETKKLLKNQ